MVSDALVRQPHRPESQMSDERLAEIEARCATAIEGPWESGDGYGGRGDIGIYALGMELANVQETIPEVARFIAHARQDVPELVAEVRRLRRALALSEAKPRTPSVYDDAGRRYGEPAMPGSGA